MNDQAPYNPLDKKNLGASVAEAMLTRAPRPLAELETFAGAGIYAIYYSGNFDAYRKLAEQNRGNDPAMPIYVGKAIPAGGRKGAAALDSSRSKALVGRLREHAESIEMASNLRLVDFDCRYLVVDDIWIPLGESLLIGKFSPIWNTMIDGFGNHDPGKGRYGGMCPRWDVLHPGRAWAAKCMPRPETAAQIGREIKAHLTNINFSSQRYSYVGEEIAIYDVRPAAGND